MKAILKYGVLALAMVTMAAGCASGGGGGASDAEVIDGMVTDMLAALEGQDIDKMVSYYSEDFESDQGGDKAATKEFLAGAKEQGFLEGIEVDSSSSETVVEGDKATVGPIDLEGAFGALTLEFDLEKRNGSWIVVYMAQY